MPHGYDYDVTVIGAGIAGMVSAVTANGLGKRVAVVEKRKVGGNCTNYTCIPSKTLVRLSHITREFSRLEHFGLSTDGSSLPDTGGVMDRVRAVVQRSYDKDRPDTFEDIGIEILTGTAAFEDRHHIKVDGRVISTDRVILAVGTRPMIPPIDGLDRIDYLTNENLYELDELPKSVIILGGGVDGLEYASALGRLGVGVTVVEMATRLLPGVDRELVNHLLSVLEADGIRILSGSKAVRVDNKAGAVELQYEHTDTGPGTVEAERLLVAIGRKPDLDGLSLDNAGVKHDRRGITADAALRTSAPNIYAAGDVVGPYQLASTAEYQGIVAATNAVLPIKRKVDYRNNVSVIFTDPPIASIGLTEQEARKKYEHKLRVYRFDYKGMRRAMIDGTEIGLAKFLCDGRGRLVGAHILGEAAPEVIHEAQIIKAVKKPLHRFNEVTHAYPTYAQALVGRASQLAFLERMSESSAVKLALGVYPGLRNRLHLALDRLAETHPPAGESRTARLDVVVNGSEGPSDVAHVSAANVEGSVCVVELPENLTDHDERPIVSAANAAAPTAGSEIAFNFGNVRAMNGLGATMLVKLFTWTKRNYGLPAVFGLPPGMRDVFRVTSLDRACRIYEGRIGPLSMAASVPESQPRETLSMAQSAIDTSQWREPAERLRVGPMPDEARNLNVEGLQAVGPVSGFGSLWEKVYRLHISDASLTPSSVFAALKADFSDFQPSFNRFYVPEAGIKPGEVVAIDSITPGGPVSTGIVVLYADELSFTFMCPQGHPEAGFITFSAHETEHGAIVQICGLTRANDPLYEAAFHFAGSSIQIRIWKHVLTMLAAHLGIPAEITIETRCLDNRFQWSEARNIWFNAQIRTLLHEPRRWIRRF